jgi:hypothetical protein
MHIVALVAALLAGPLPPSAFRVQWEAIETPGRIVRAGEPVRALVRFRNASDRVWPDVELAGASGKNAVRMGCRWIGANRKILTEFTRADLPFPLLPNQSIELATSISAPHEPGLYRLQCDLVQEWVAWFGDKGNPRPSVTIRVPGPPR